MRIFSDTYSFNTESYPDNIEPTMETMVEMGAELTESVYKLNTSLYITTLLLEQKAQAGEDVESLMEAAVGDFFKNMGARFKSMADRIKAFFSGIFNKIQVFVSDGKKFIAMYKDGIRKAATSSDVQWITYDEREYTLTADIDKELNNTMKAVHDSIDVINKIPDDLLNKTTQTDYKKMFEDVFKSFPEEVKKEENNNSKQIPKTGVVETLNSQKLNEFLNQVNQYVNGGKDRLKRCMNDCNNLCTTSISKLKRFEARATANVTKEGKLTVITDACKEISEAIRKSQKHTSKMASLYTKSYRYSLKVLRAFVSKNSKIITKTKTVAGEDDTKETTSTKSETKQSAAKEKPWHESATLLESILYELQ